MQPPKTIKPIFKHNPPTALQHPTGTMSILATNRTVYAEWDEQAPTAENIISHIETSKTAKTDYPAYLDSHGWVETVAHVLATTQNAIEQFELRRYPLPKSLITTTTNLKLRGGKIKPSTIVKWTLPDGRAFALKATHLKTIVNLIKKEPNPHIYAGPKPTDPIVFKSDKRVIVLGQPLHYGATALN